MVAAWQARAWQTGCAAAFFYICFFSVTAFQLFNMTAWLGSKGIAAQTAGRLQGLSDLFFVVGVLLAGLLADWKGFNRRLFLGFFALALMGYILLGVTAHPWGFGVALCLISFAFLPLTNLTDTHLQPYISRDLMPYARIRALGSAAFAVVILTLAFMGEGAILAAFYPAILAFLILTGISLIFLPAHPVHTPAPLSHKFTTFTKLLRQPKFLLFYLTVAVIFGSHGAHYIYAVPIWRDWGFSSGMIYGVLGWGVIVEILFFVFAPKALTEQRAVPLLTICALAAVVRWVAWPFVDGWVGLLLVHGLHVFTFALTHLTSLAFLRRRVCETQLGAAQALLPAISIGVGMATAKFLAAQFYDQGAALTFFIMAGFAAIAFPLLLSLYFLLGKRPTSQETAVLGESALPRGKAPL